MQIVGGSVCALDTGGGIRCWGDSEATEQGSRPGSFARFDASDDGYCAVDVAGRVGCWGAVGESGEWGRWGAPEGQFSQVSVVDGHGCGVRVDTTLECWPRPDFGEPYRWTVSLLPEGPGFVSVRIGHGSVCAVRADSTVWCWNLSDEDQAVADAGGFAEAWPTEYGFCGLRSDGAAFCSEERLARDLPDGPLLEFFPDHECGLAPDGRLDCWGYSGVGSPPEGVGPLVSAASVWFQVCGVDAAGLLVCWSNDERGGGELRDLDDWLASYQSAGRESLGSAGPVAEVFVGGGNDNGGWCVLDARGEVGCRWWSDSVRGLEVPNESPPPGRFVDVAVGSRHACGIRESGTVACWGEDSDVVESNFAPLPDPGEGR